MRFDVAARDYLRQINSCGFEEAALALFHFQKEHCAVYQAYLKAIHQDQKQVSRLCDIPFLPISFFKTHEVKTGNGAAQFSFASSGTTGLETSRHLVQRPELYEMCALAGFKKFYGEPAPYAFLALLPSYLERSNSSLVYMAQLLMQASGHPANGFFKDDFECLAQTLQQLEKAGQPVLLLGVTFGLLDFAERFPMPLKHTLVMETGGMKGRRAEWTRAEVHAFLKEQFLLPAIHAEYGMTELFSQAYSKGSGIFYPIDTMRVLLRDPQDPLSCFEQGRGALNIIDLANVDSCAFIATEDLGQIQADGGFQVLGRMDHSALRGCSLLMA